MRGTTPIRSSSTPANLHRLHLQMPSPLLSKSELTTLPSLQHGTHPYKLLFLPDQTSLPPIHTLTSHTHSHPRLFTQCHLGRCCCPALVYYLAPSLVLTPPSLRLHQLDIYLQHHQYGGPQCLLSVPVTASGLPITLPHQSFLSALLSHFHPKLPSCRVNTHAVTSEVLEQVGLCGAG